MATDNQISYYRNQRLNDEKKAEGGDFGSAQELKKIAGKTGNKREIESAQNLYDRADYENNSLIKKVGDFAGNAIGYVEGGRGALSAAKAAPGIARGVGKAVAEHGIEGAAKEGLANAGKFVKGAGEKLKSMIPKRGGAVETEGTVPRSTGKKSPTNGEKLAKTVEGKKRVKENVRETYKVPKTKGKKASSLPLAKSGRAGDYPLLKSEGMKSQKAGDYPKLKSDMTSKSSKDPASRKLRTEGNVTRTNRKKAAGRKAESGKMKRKAGATVGASAATTAGAAAATKVKKKAAPAKETMSRYPGISQLDSEWEK